MDLCRDLELWGLSRGRACRSSKGTRGVVVVVEEYLSTCQDSSLTLCRTCISFVL